GGDLHGDLAAHAHARRRGLPVGQQPGDQPGTRRGSRGRVLAHDFGRAHRGAGQPGRPGRRVERAGQRVAHHTVGQAGAPRPPRRPHPTPSPPGFRPFPHPPPPLPLARHGILLDATFWPKVPSRGGPGRRERGGDTMNETGMPSAGWLLVIGGALLLGLGLLVVAAEHLPFLGGLPGHLHWSGEHGSRWWPRGPSLLLSVVVSVVLTVLLNLPRR